MTHIAIDLDAMDWTPFLVAQEGKGNAGGGGGVDGGGSRYFQGVRYQRGFGLMSTVGRFLMPIVRNIATTAGEQAKLAGQKVLVDLATGRPIQETLTEHGGQALHNIGQKLQQCGKGKRGRRRKGSKKVSFVDTVINPPVIAKKPRRYRDQLSEEF